MILTSVNKQIESTPTDFSAFKKGWVKNFISNQTQGFKEISQVTVKVGIIFRIKVLEVYFIV